MRSVTTSALAATALAIIAPALAGCAAVRSLVGQPSPPPPVQGVLTSAIDREPYTVFDLADPMRRRMVESCEAARRRDCRTRPVARDRRTSFTKGVDRQVVALFSLAEPVPGTARGIACRFLGPSGRLAAQVRIRAAIPADAPRGAALTFPCSIALAQAAPAGSWALELTLDGEKATVLPFEVRDAPRPPPRPAAAPARAAPARAAPPAPPVAAPRALVPRPPPPRPLAPRPAGRP